MERHKDRLKSLTRWIGVGVAMGLLVALLDPTGKPFSGWLAYTFLGAVGVLALWGAWRWIGGPNALVAAVAVAVILRLFVGLGLRAGLPALGYPDSEPHQAGYFYLDAYRRDLDAWRLAQLSVPLTDAFSDQAESDQYGGLLFASGLIYRTLSPSEHRPMLPIVMNAIVGGLAVLFTWGFVKLSFGSKPGMFAAWGVAVYPEAVLLGASQMREPLLIGLLAGMLYGYARYRNGDGKIGIAIIIAAAGIALAVSPPYALLMLAVVLVGLVWEVQGRHKAQWVGVALVVVLGLLALSLTVGAWQKVTAGSSPNPLALVGAWISDGARFELFKLERGSGWVQLLFDRTPEWANIPMATGNGLVQPFFPATLMDSTSLPLPRAIGIARGLGWFLLLPFLVYVPFAALRGAGWRSLQTYLTLVVWIVMIGASYRLAGDQWDNPRARAVFLAPQMALAGWAWYHAREVKSPWLLRSGVLVGVASLLFIQWYAGRYYQTPRLSLFKTVGVLAVFAVVFLVGAVVLDVVRARREARLTTDAPEV
ncbi:MAG: hypothetical protein IIB10_12485 [Chloroflexi bacterium]|nr:hypothetical protein [Chloroflexota bacterium]